MICYQIPGGPFVCVINDATEYQLAGYGYINLGPALSGSLGQFDPELRLAAWF